MYIQERREKSTQQTRKQYFAWNVRDDVVLLVMSFVRASNYSPPGGSI